MTISLQTFTVFTELRYRERGRLECVLESVRLHGEVKSRMGCQRRIGLNATLNDYIFNAFSECIIFFITFPVMVCLPGKFLKALIIFSSAFHLSLKFLASE